MSDASVAHRYARALLELADEAQAVDKVADDLETLRAVLSKTELLGVMTNPVFTSAERREGLVAVVNRVGFQALTRSFLQLLLQKGRFQNLPEVLDAFRALYDKRANRARVQLSTAAPLTPELEREVTASLERVTGRQVALEITVDPSLIGGIIARVGGKVYDSSIKSRLQDIKTGLLFSADR